MKRRANAEPRAGQTQIHAFCKIEWSALLHPATCTVRHSQILQCRRSSFVTDDKGIASGSGVREVDVRIESVLSVDGLCCSSEVATLKVKPFVAVRCVED